MEQQKDEVAAVMQALLESAARAAQNDHASKELLEAACAAAELSVKLLKRALEACDADGSAADTERAGALASGEKGERAESGETSENGAARLAWNAHENAAALGSIVPGVPVAESVSTQSLDGVLSAQGALTHERDAAGAAERDSVRALDAAPAAQKKKKPAGADALLAGKRVLLCEDQSVTRLILSRMLEDVGVKTVCAENGREGLLAFRESTPGGFDAILMDIQMPEMDGLTAAQRIRALRRSDALIVPILALTANDCFADVRKSQAAGMNAHLAKPVEPGTLYATLRQFWGAPGGK